MTDRIEVLGCEARQGEHGSYAARTALGLVLVMRWPDDPRWCALWVPRGAKSMVVTLCEHEPIAADAAREATRRLRAIQRTCARAEVSR